MSLPAPAPLQPAVAERANPFKGLAYFERVDAAHFAGRQREVEAVVSGILRTRTFVLYGRSGLGKTSLLLAGVFPRLAEQGCVPLDVRLLQDPLGDLRQALVRHAGIAVDAAEADDLAALVERVGRTVDGKDRLVVIAFDQFEEFFVRFADQPDPAGGVRSGEELDRKVRQQRIAQRQAFIQAMGELAADSRLNLRLVFSLREDWIAEMGDFTDAISEITHYMYRLLPLTSFGVRQAIVETLRSTGTEFDSRLVSALVDTLADVNFDPIMLQVLCSEVWERAQARDDGGEPARLELADLEAIGGVRQVFRGYLDQINSESDSQDLRRKILTGSVLEALISEKRTKLAVSRESLLQQTYVITEGELDEVLDRLYRHRLVRSDPRGGIRWFELVHERLVGAILEWFETDLDFFNFRSGRNLVVNSCRNPGWRENPELLLNRGQLDDTVGPFKTLLRFSDEERLFLVSSAVYAHSRDLEYWAELAGDQTSAELLERFLDQAEHEQLRWRAAQAAGRVAERPEHFAARCLQLALHDPSPEVRQAAARSFADLASAREFQTLAERLRERRTRNAALDVLAEVMDKEKVPREVKLGRQRMWQARRRLFRRRLDVARKVVRERSRRGALVGLRAALLWSVTAGTLLLRITLYELFPEAGMESVWVWPVYSAIYMLVTFPVGTFIGWWAARRAAQEALRRGREGSTFRALVGKVIPVVCGVVFLAWLLMSWKDFSTGRIDEGGAYLGIGVAVLLVLLLELAVVVTLALPTIWPKRGRREVPWIVAWAWALGGSLLPSTLVLPLVMSFDSLRNPEVKLRLVATVGALAFGWASAFLGGLVTYSSQLSVALTLPEGDSQDELRLAIPPPVMSARSRRIRTALGALLALVPLVLLTRFFGWDGLPFLAHRVLLGATDISRGVREQPLGIGAFHIEVVAPGEPHVPRLAGVSFPPTWKAYFFGGRGDLKSGEALVLRAGESRHIAFEPGKKGWNRFQIRPDRPLTAAAPLKEGQLVVARLTRKDDAWSGRIPGLERLGPGRPLFLNVGSVLQGDNWCSQAGFALRVSGPRRAGNSLVTRSCVPGLQQIGFPTEIPWTTQARVPVFTVRAWKRVYLTHALLTWAKFMPDGSSVATLALALHDDLATFYLWSLDGSRAQIAMPAISLRDADLSPDGKWIALISTVSNGGAVSLWRADGSGSPIQLLRNGPVKMARFSPDGVHLATVEPYSVKVWRVASPMRLVAELRYPRGGSKEIEWVTFNSAGTRIAFGDDDNARVSTLDGSYTKAIDLKAIPEDEIPLWAWVSPAFYNAAFSADGSRFLRYDSGTVQVWRLHGSRTRRVARFFQPGVNLAVLNRDGSRVATATEDGNVRIWNVDGSGDPIVLNHGANVKEIEFSRDGSHVLTVSDGPTPQVWDISRPFQPQEAGDLFLFLRVNTTAAEQKPGAY